MQQGRESALVTIADDLEADITDKKRVVIGKYLRIKGQVLKIRACNTAQVAVLQHEWRSHECCITCKYFQYLTFNSQVFILFDFSF